MSQSNSSISGHLATAIQSLQRRDYASALSILEQHGLVRTSIPQIRLAHATCLIELGRIAEGREVLSAILSEFANCHEAQSILDEINMNKSSTSVALEGTQGAVDDCVPKFSPVTGSSRIILESKLDTSLLIQAYAELGVPATKYYGSRKTIPIYRCLDTEYRFYYPFTLAGDGELYSILERQPWYYMQKKWEHEIAEELIRPGSKVLEIGCGPGSFLAQLSAQGFSVQGLELSSTAIDSAKSKGLEVLNRSIERHAEHAPNQYDFVCAFEVLEHIAHVKEFIDASIKCLKPGGKLFFSVPNNDAFIFKCDDRQTMNRPPHHMGLWNATSLINLCTYFPISVNALRFEPLQEYHVKWSRDIFKQFFRRTAGAEAARLLPTYEPIVDLVSEALLKQNPGHTLAVCYTRI